MPRKTNKKTDKYYTPSPEEVEMIREFYRKVAEKVWATGVTDPAVSDFEFYKAISKIFK
jgi:hypothetical protein